MASSRIWVIFCGEFTLRDQLGRGLEIGVGHHAQFRQHLFGDLAKHRRGNVASVICADGFIDDHDDHDCRVVNRREADKRRDVFRRGVGARPGINLLRGAGFARRRVTIELCLSSRFR